MIEVALAKLTALGLAAKLGVATGALALTGTAAAATGALPDPVVDAIERTGIEIPGGRSAEHRQDGDHRQDADQRQDADHRQDADRAQDARTAETPAEADFGTGVSGSATSGAPQEDGAQFGEDVSTTARETFQPTDTPTTEDNPGTDASDDAGTQQPESTPTAENNPGTSRRP